MKTLATISFIIISQLSFSQNNDFSGMWISETTSEEMPIGFEFLSDGNLNVYEMKEQNSTQTFKILDANYYTESGDDKIAIITWYGDQAKTSIYSYSFENGQLIMKDDNSNQKPLNYSREDSLANL
jgi:hypothetical protein